MEVTAEPVREECLKGLLNGEAVFALVRSQVSPGDERIEPCLGHTNRKPLQIRHRGAARHLSVTGTNLLLTSQPSSAFSYRGIESIADEPARSRGAYRGSPTSTVGLVSIWTLKLP